MLQRSSRLINTNVANEMISSTTAIAVASPYATPRGGPRLGLGGNLCLYGMFRKRRLPSRIAQYRGHRLGKACDQCRNRVGRSHPKSLPARTSARRRFFRLRSRSPESAGPCVPRRQAHKVNHDDPNRGIGAPDAQRTRYCPSHPSARTGWRKPARRPRSAGQRQVDK